MKQCTVKQLPSGNWHTQVRYQDKEGNNKRKSITAPTEWEVIKLADDFRKGLIEETTHMTVKTAIESYIDNRRNTRSEATIYGYENIARNRLQSIMKKDIRELTKSDINRAINLDAARGMGHKSIKEALALLKSALDENGVDIPSTKKFALPPKPPKKGELPDLKIVLSIIVGSSVELPCLLSLWCGGMRISEVRGLQYRDISDDDEGRHYIFINRSRICVNGHDFLRDVNKTEQSTRKVQLPDYLYGLIAKKAHNSDDDFIIDESYGAIQRRYDRLLRKNGIVMTLHDLRAQFATTMNGLGIEKEILQKMGGWSNSKVLDDVYIRTPKKAIDDSMSIYNDYISSIMPSDLSHEVSHEII